MAHSPRRKALPSGSQEKLDGKPVDWLEHVTAEQYEGRSSGGWTVRPVRPTGGNLLVSPFHHAPTDRSGIDGLGLDGHRD